MDNKNSFERASAYSHNGLRDEASKIAEMLGVSLPNGNDKMKEDTPLYEQKISLHEVIKFITDKGMRISDNMIRRYHLSLINKGFLILSGISGTGKTWLAELYAQAINAKYLVVPVAPNWTSNEDLLGFYNPIDNEYKHTSFSQFLKEAQSEFAHALEEGRHARPYHIILDEMNLARVEYYFAKFLSFMEIRSRGGEATIELPPDDRIVLTPNLFFIGTINVDETTHGIADKVYDRAQLLEMEIDREDIISALGDKPYKSIILAIWDTINEQAPFAYRVINDMKRYVDDAIMEGVDWRIAIDEQVLQKILPKLKGINVDTGTKLEELKELLEAEQLKLSERKLTKMLEGYSQYGVITYF